MRILTRLKSTVLPFFLVLQIIASFFLLPRPIFAVGDCSIFTTDPPQIPPGTWYTNITNSPTVTIGGGLKNEEYYLFIDGDYQAGRATAEGGQIVVKVKETGILHRVNQEGPHTFTVKKEHHEITNSKFEDICSRTYQVKPYAVLECTIDTDKAKENLSYGPDEHVLVTGKFWNKDASNNKTPYEGTIDLRLWYKQSADEKQRVDTATDSSGSFSNNKLTIPAVPSTDDIGFWVVSASGNVGPRSSIEEKKTCTKQIYVSQHTGEPAKGTPPSGGGAFPGENPCKIDPVDGKLKCQTALGSIPTNPADFVQATLGIAIGLAGGIALIFMVMGAIKVLTSSGDQKKLTEGRDQIIAALSGLLLLIFSVLILRFMGTTLLGGIAGIGI